MQKLVNEHTLIKRWVAMIPRVINNLDVESEAGRQLVIDGIEFIRSYADKYHHAKEEEVLFKCFDDGLDIIKAICEDHETARAHVRAMLVALDKRDKKAVSEHLQAYQELLSEHIKKKTKSYTLGWTGVSPSLEWVNYSLNLMRKMKSLAMYLSGVRGLLIN